MTLLRAILASVADLAGYWGGIIMHRLDPRTIKKEH